MAISVKIISQTIEDGNSVIGFEAYRDEVLLFDNKLNFGKADERSIRKSIKSQIDTFIANEGSAPPDLSSLVGVDIPLASIPLPPTQSEIDAETVQQEKLADILANIPSRLQVRAAIAAIANLSDAKNFIGKLTEVVYWMAKGTKA